MSTTPITAEKVKYDQPWLGSLLRPVLIASMVACVAQTMLTFVARVAPFLAESYVPTLTIISVGAAVVGCISTTLLAQPNQRHRRTFGYRLAEVGLLLALTRLAIWVVTGSWPTPALFFIHPLDALFDGLFIVGGVVVGLAWLMATDTTDDLLRMALQPDELYAIEADRIGEMVRTSHMDRPAILRGLVARWVAGGILMVILAAGLGMMGAHSFFTLAQQAVQPGIVAAIILYFLAGLILISHGQLAILRSRWTIDRVPSAPNVLRNWPLYVLLLLLLIGSLATLMPFGGTFRLATILGAVISFMFNLMLDLFRLLALLFMLLMSLLTGKAPPAPNSSPPPPPPGLPTPTPADTAHLPLWAGGVLFWGTMVLLLGYAAYIYFSGKGQLGWLAAFWQMLRLRWAQFWGAYQNWQLDRRAAVRRSDPSAESQQGDVTKRWRLRNLDPDQQVRYLYLATLEYAEQLGLPRKRSETPLQYAPRLRAQLADEMTDKSEVETLTNAFIQVRYSQQPIDAEQVPVLQEIWQRIKQHLHM
jgi:hypothetical protein